MVKRLKLDIDVIKKEYLEELKTKEEICNKHDVSLSQLNNFLFYYDLTKTELYKTGISKEELEKTYYNKSLSNIEICDKLSCCEQTLRKLLKKYKIKNRYDYSEYKDAVCNMYLDFYSTAQIAKELNIPKSRVRSILLDNGIEMRNKRLSQVARCDILKTNFKWEEYSTKLFKKCRAYFSNHITTGIKIRDNCTCCECGNNDNLHVHHKVAFSKIMYLIVDEYKNHDCAKDENKMYEVIISHPLFLDQDNLITVCAKCHYTIYHPEYEYSKIISNQAIM